MGTRPSAPLQPVLPGWVFKLYFCFTFPVIKARAASPPALLALLVVLILHLLDPESATGPKGKPRGFLQSTDLSAALESRGQAGRGAEEASRQPKLPLATNSPPLGSSGPVRMGSC